MKQFLSLLVIVTILLSGCHSEEYNKAISLVKDESSIEELYEISKNENISKSEKVEITEIIDSIFNEMVADLPDKKASLVIIDDLLGREEISSNGRSPLLRLRLDISVAIDRAIMQEVDYLKTVITQGMDSKEDIEGYRKMVDEHFNDEFIDEESVQVLYGFIDQTYLEWERQDRDSRGWEKGYYVDSFGDRTGETFTRKRIVGVFSNSATSNSELGIDILFNGNSIDFRIYEYGFSRNVEEEFLDSLWMKMRNENSEDLNIYVHRLTGGPKASLFFRNNDEFRSIVRLFENSEEVRVRVESGNSNYQFTVDTKYFNDSI